MVRSFPPSSPVASNAFESSPFKQENGDLASKDYKGKSVQLEEQHDRCYPTPYPSSSVGRSSSPIRKIISSNSSPDSKKLASPLQRTESNPKYRQVSIEFDRTDCSRLMIGRKHGICDIILPSYKWISRQHAFISYVASENRVELHCIGTNGCVVSLPVQWECELVQLDASKRLFELRSSQNNDNDGTEHSYTKEVISDPLLTSFVLLQGETITMPFVKGTVLDFRQVEAILSLKQTDPFEHSEHNDNKTEGEMMATITGCDDFCRIENTPKKSAAIQRFPSTPCIEREENIRGLAPQKEVFTLPSVSLGLLSTPTKPRKSDLYLDSQRQMQGSPLGDRIIPDRRKKETHFVRNSDLPKFEFKCDKTTSFKESSSKSRSGKEGDDSQRKTKRHKPSPIFSSTDSIIHSLEEDGVDCSSLQHALANYLAFSSILQTPLYQLEHVNSTIATLSREHLRALLAKEHCIGVIHREGKDAAGKPLDEEYFYDVENDNNIERRNLVLAVKGGRSGLRSCRRVHKQYFWKKPTM